MRLSDHVLYVELRLGKTTVCVLRLHVAAKELHSLINQLIGQLYSRFVVGVIRLVRMSLNTVT